LPKSWGGCGAAKRMRPNTVLAKRGESLNLSPTQKGRQKWRQLYKVCRVTKGEGKHSRGAGEWSLSRCRKEKKKTKEGEGHSKKTVPMVT